MGKVSLIALPYDSGKFNERMGRGPLRLIEDGLGDRLRENGHDVDCVVIRLSEDFHTEASALIELQKQASAVVRQAIAAKRFPILLSGNCGPAAFAACSAMGPKRGVIWFDAHADFNTPETSASGFLDGMSLSILTGRCWSNLSKQFEGFAPVPERDVLLVGARDFDPAEVSLLHKSEIRQIGPGNSAAFEDAMNEFSRRIESLYVHVDMDVLDDSEGRANSYACGDGLSATELGAALEVVRQSGKILVASITAYDPSLDHDHSVQAAIEEVTKRLTRPIR